MFQRLLTPLLVSLLLSKAPGLDYSASGGQWTQYEPATPAAPTLLPQLVGRGDEVQVKAGYRLKVNVATGTVDQAPRPGFDPATDFIIADGDSPVFWTRSYGEPNGTISVRDWSTGAVTGTATLPDGLSSAKLFIDEHGIVLCNNGGVNPKVGVAGLNGQNPLTATPQTIPYSATTPRIAASADWLAVSCDTASGFQRRIEVYDRHTLAYKAGIGPTSEMLSVRGNLLACATSTSITIRQLPGLNTLATIPLLQNPNGLIDFTLVDGGLWIFERAPNAFGKEFRYFDLSNPSAPAAGHRIAPPAPASDVGWPFTSPVAAPGYLAYSADDDSLWVWKRGGSGPVAKIVPLGTAREGEPASFKIQLSSPAPAAAQVQVSALGASAVEGQDFSTFSTTVNIPAGATESATLQVTTLQDTTLEPDESFFLTSGSSTGCVVEQPKVPVVIAGNGYNVDVHRKYPTMINGSFRLDEIFGLSGNYLVGFGHHTPQMAGDYGRTVAVDVATNAVVGELPGGITSTSGDTFLVRHGILFRNSLDLASAWQLPGFQPIGTSVSAGFGKLLGPVSAQTMLVRKIEPNRLVLAKISDGSQVTTHALNSSEATVVIADAIEGIPGGAIVVLDSGTSPQGDPIQVLKMLNPATLAAERTLSWPSYHPQLGISLKVKAVAGRYVILTGFYGISAIDSVTGDWLWTVPTTAESSGFGSQGDISGDVLMMRGVSLTGTLDESPRFYSFDMKSGALLDKRTFEEIAGTAFLPVLKSVIQPTAAGFFIANGRNAASITLNPSRPNVELLAQPFEDNRSGELEIVPKENFSGGHSLTIDEYAEVRENLGSDARLFSGLPQQINLTAGGDTLTLDCKRPANGAELVRFSAMSSAVSTSAASGFGKTTVTTHVKAPAELPFFTGGPVRNTQAVPLAASGNVLAIGYPIEPEPFTNPTGVVDLYDKTTGAFLRSIEAPAGVSKMRFGAALAITGNRIVIGAPGNNGYPSLPGKVFVFDLSTGAKVAELKMKKTLAFGSSIAANGSWIAVGAPGTYRVLPPTGIYNRKPLPGTVAVFDATTLKLRYKATTKGEMLGWSVALDGDTLFAGAPLASLRLPVRADFAGIVRPYTLPKGKAKGKALPILGALHPVTDGHFGEKIAVSSTLLAVQSANGPDGKGIVQVHPRSNLGLAAFFGVPGADMEEGVLHATDTHIFAGGWSEPLRIFDLDDQRPEASYAVHDNAAVQDIATDDDYFYWADTKPHRLPLPAAPSSARAMAGSLPGDEDTDLNHDGRTDAIDLLLAQRADKGMPVKIESAAAGQFRFALDADIPDGMAVSFEYSTNLSQWSPLLAWDAATKRWQDAAGNAIGDAGAAAWLHEWQAPGAKVFFRTKVEMIMKAEE